MILKEIFVLTSRMLIIRKLLDNNEFKREQLRAGVDAGF